MARRIDAYVDTSAFIAFLDRSDSYHSLFAARFAEPPTLITSALVLAEGHGWFLRRYDQRRAREFLAFVTLLAPKLEVEPFDSIELERVDETLNKYPDQALTLADAHGLTLMLELKIRECWSTDWHMGLGGVGLAIH